MLFVFDLIFEIDFPENLMIFDDDARQNQLQAFLQNQTIYDLMVVMEYLLKGYHLYYVY